MATTIDDPNITLFDGSNWKQYDNAAGGWHAGTYHETCDDRDDLSFSFTGTSIQVFGAKRPTYGYYYAEIDGENRRFFNAHSNTDEIPALLFEAKDLGEGDHSLWFMNQQNYGDQRSRSCIGIDYIVVNQSSQPGSGAPLPSESESAAPASESAAPASSDANVSAPSSESAFPTPSPTPSAESTDTVVGQPVVSSTSSTGNALTVPNLANYTMAPSADEVNAPNATWTADTMTAITGVPGVYSGQPLPVFTGQAINYNGAAPKLQQEVFASAVRAGATSAGTNGVSMPGVQIGVMFLVFWSIRRFWAL